LVVNKLEKRHASRPRKVVTAILSSRDIKKEDENILRMGAKKEEGIITYKR
jgi:hypothetical protein